MSYVTLPFNPEQDSNIGPLVVTDAQLLVRPRRVLNQRPAGLMHDIAHAKRILDLGNGMSRSTYHIISQQTVDATYWLLDGVFYGFVDGCNDLWCEARVNYIVNNRVIKTNGFGLSDGEDGQYIMFFNVYCDVAPDQMDAFLAQLMHDSIYITVRPDGSEDGYAVDTVAHQDDPEFFEPDGLWDDLVEGSEEVNLARQF